MADKEAAMNSHIIIETIGYIGSAIVLVSFLMTSVFKLRVVNTIGSVIFMIYALIIHTYPTAIMNLCLALINIHFLWKMRHTGKEYELLELRMDDLYLQYLLEKYEKDIDTCFPGIELSKGKDPHEAYKCYLITCQGAPAGIVLGTVKNQAINNQAINNQAVKNQAVNNQAVKNQSVNNQALNGEADSPGASSVKTLNMLLDYALPEYRDFSIGEFISIKLKEQGYGKLAYSGPTANHMAYLNKLEYKEHNGVFEKEL